MDKPVLITGASRGLGAALAVALAPHAPIIAVARTTGALEEVDDAIRAAGGSATLAPMDITVPEAMQQLCLSIHERWGGLSLWCHTAIHAGPLAPAAHLAEKDMEKSLSINVAATARLIAYVSPLLGEGGKAVFFDDPRGGERFFGHYGSTKAAQIALARSWQEESQRTGPKVEILSPPPMPTATRARFFPGEDRSALTPPEAAAEALLPAILT